MLATMSSFNEVFIDQLKAKVLRGQTDTFKRGGIVQHLGTSGGQGAGVDGGIWQFAIGTCAADNTSYSIAFNGVGFYLPIINGFQLRTVCVPDPSGSIVALAGLPLGFSPRGAGHRRSPAPLGVF